MKRECRAGLALLKHNAAVGQETPPVGTHGQTAHIPKGPRTSEVRRNSEVRWSDFWPCIEITISQIAEPSRPAGETTALEPQRPMGHRCKHKRQREPLYLVRWGHAKESRVRLTEPRVLGQNPKTKKQSEAILVEERSMGASTDREPRHAVLPESRVSDQSASVEGQSSGVPTTSAYRTGAPSDT